jgi:hypothetical protein
MRLFSSAAELGIASGGADCKGCGACASTVRCMESARPAASKPGPRLAEVAGSAIPQAARCCADAHAGCGALRHGCVSRHPDAQHTVRIRVEHDRLAAHLRVLREFGGARAGQLLLAQQLAAVVVDGVAGILERVAGEQQDGGLFLADAAVGDQLLQAGERDRRGGLAADALRADLGLGQRDLALGDLLAPAAGRGQHAHRLLP